MKKAEKQSFIDVMESFTESYLPLEKGCVQNTIKSYKTTYGLLIDYLFDEKGIPSDSITFEQLDYAMLTSFLQWLQEKRGVRCIHTKSAFSRFEFIRKIRTEYLP